MQSRNLVITLGLALVLIGLVLIAPYAKVAALPDAPATTRSYPGAAPCNTTLQACISVSANGDVVNVLAGTYVTNQLAITRAITLQGAGASSTILQANGSHGVINIGSSIAAGVVISNLAIMSGTTTNGGGIFSGSGTPLTLLNMDILSNTATTNGGGVFATNAVTLTNVNFVNNRANGGLGGGLRANSSAIVNGGRFERNSALNGGGAIQAGTYLTLFDVIVISNTSTSATFNGGGIRADGSLFIQNGLVENNVSGNDGGGISAASAIISNTSIISNAGNDGGGLFVTGNLATTNTLFFNNSARTGNGGAIDASGNVTITLEGTSDVSNTDISANTAANNGGGIYAAGNVLLVGEAAIDLNTASTGEGGAIYANNVSDLEGNSVLLIVHFINNRSASNGGAIRALGNVSLLNSPALKFNQAGGGTTADGGAIYANGTVFLSRGSSSGNSARGGGAVYALEDITFNVHDTGPNTALMNGGCAYSLKQITYNSADAIGCSAGQNGGAAFSPLTITLKANGVSVFRQNHAGDSGGMAFANAVIVRSATIYSNSAVIGGALAATKTLDIADSSIYSNTAAKIGGAAAGITGSAFITNSIFASNRVTGTIGLGGAVWVTGTIDISNSTFLSNTIGAFAASGGGIGATRRINITGGSFQGNQAATGGGVFGLADVTVAGTDFTSNGTVNDRSGGGIAGITVTLSAVKMTGNSVCCTNASGGAVSATLAFITGSTFIQNSAFISGGAVIANQVFVTNSVFISNSFVDEGAGIWTKNGGTITNSIFTGNSTGCCSERKGGAVFTKGQIFIYNSQFNKNESDTGGALYIQSNFSEVHDSQFNGNFVDCCTGGGAIYSLGFGPYIYNTTFTGNYVNCCDDGGAISAGSSLYVEHSTFQNNFVDTGSGGAIFIPIGISAVSEITVSTFISNSASANGGAIDAQRVEVGGSTFISNTAGSSFSGGAVNIHGFGGFDDDVFQSNRVTLTPASCTNGNGGALASDAASSLSLQRSTFVGNSAYNGGAIFARDAAIIDTSAFIDNSASCLDSSFFSNVGYGGAIVGQKGLTIRRSSFIHNSAGSIGGGAIFYQPSITSTLRVENSLFARNVATNTVFGAVGAAIAVTNANTTQLFYNTFANGTTTNSVSAIAIYIGTASLIDNIIVNHSTGIEKILGGNVAEDFNLFFNNTPNTSGGVTSGGNKLTNNDPLFVSAATDDYHLTLGSPAIDAATDLAITEDYDGDTRPNGASFDIGFDERNAAAHRIYLPLILKNH